MSDLELENEEPPVPTGLRVSEMFLSIQGEGVTAGVPAVFLRLAGCDFHCRFCDTIPVHSRYDWYTYEALIEEMTKRGLVTALSKGARLIITGGNPLLQQAALVQFLPLLIRAVGLMFNILPVEVETQGSIKPSVALQSFVWQWNVSPKLTNSGESARKRCRAQVMEFHSHHRDSHFKFVVSSEADLAEIENDFVKPFQIDWSRVSLMPMCSTRHDQNQLAQKVVEMCLKVGARFSPRLQLMIWDRATGV